MKYSNYTKGSQCGGTGLLKWRLKANCIMRIGHKAMTAFFFFYYSEYYYSGQLIIHNKRKSSGAHENKCHIQEARTSVHECHTLSF